MGGPLGPPRRDSGVPRRGHAARERVALLPGGPGGDRAQPRPAALDRRAVRRVHGVGGAVRDCRAAAHRRLPLPLPRDARARGRGAVLVHLPRGCGADPVRRVHDRGCVRGDRPRRRVRQRRADPRRGGRGSRARPRRYQRGPGRARHRRYGRGGLPVRDAAPASPARGAPQPLHGHPRCDRGSPRGLPAHGCLVRDPGLLARRARDALPRQLAGRARSRLGERPGGALADRGAEARPGADAGAGGGAHARPNAAPEPEPVPERPASRKRRRKKP